jgi:superfamily I DNA and/or RNA helicase
VFSTLSGAGQELLTRVDFDSVIIDEAAQSVELSTLVGVCRFESLLLSLITTYFADPLTTSS